MNPLIEEAMTILELQVTINGKPIPCSRPRLGRRGTYMPSDYIAAKEAIIVQLKAAARVEGWPSEPITGPVSVLMTFVHSRPKRLKKTAGRVLKTTRPDIDNLSKTYLDAMQQAGIFRDDGQVCSLILSDLYAARGEEAHVFLDIRQISMEEQ